VGSAAAATTPSRLAQELGGQALWRKRADGRLEVALLRGRSIERYVVDEAGRTTLVAVSPATWWERWASRIGIGGWLLGLTAMIVAWITDPDGRSAGVAIVAALLIAFALFWIGGSASARADDLRSRLKKLGEDPDEWYEPTNLHEWVPRSGEQLAAAERIADEHEGVAYVQDTGARTVDVYAVRRGRVERYWVDEYGQAGLVEALPPHAAYFIDRALMGVALALVLALFVVGFLADENKGALLIAIGAGLGAVMVFGWLNDRRNAIERRVKPLGADGRGWVEIRTRIQDDPGE
jgi:hypothetical protein